MTLPTPDQQMFTECAGWSLQLTKEGCFLLRPSGMAHVTQNLKDPTF